MFLLRVVQSCSVMQGNVQTDSRYTAMDALGEGGVGHVYRAWDSQLQREVAIKRLKPDADAELPAWQEAQILATLQHPNIVTIFDFGTDQEGPYVVMELIDGRTLDCVVAEGPLSLDIFLELADQTLRGLSAAHSRNVVHRDLKPSNLMLHYHLDGTFTLKILDFGLAKSIVGQPSQQTMDQNNSILGSIYTMAPEQLTREPVDSRTDIYALGCVFYYALTGRFPYNGDTVAQIIQGHLHQLPLPIHSFRQDVPAVLEEVLLQMMARDPKDRPSQAESVRMAIKGAFQQATRPEQPPLPSQLRETKPTSPWLWVAGTVLLVGVATAAWSLVGNPKRVLSPESTAPAVPAAAPSIQPRISTPDEPRPATDDDGLRLVDPLNLEELRANLGRQVTVEGKIVLYGQSKSGTVRFLNFSMDFRSALALVFRVNGNEDVFSEEKLKAYLDKKVRVTGVITEFKDALQLEIQPGQEIAILE